jgi:ubiquitin-protein ligase
MDGPPDSVYAGGKFKISVTLPKEYPFKPPVIAFKTKVYHPNVSNDDRGAMCLGMLRPDEWKPPNKIVDVLKLVRTVLAAPQPDDAVEAGIADQFKTNRREFDKVAREWVAKYAK